MKSHKNKSIKRRKSHKVDVIYKKLGRERALGQCVIGENFIEIDPRQTERGLIYTTIHELLHLGLGEKASETKVLEVERLIGRTLWDLGYRRIKSQSKY